MIELKNITIETRHPILQNTTYCFSDGKIYGIVAENGSGKTTLFRTLVNLRKGKSGTIHFDNQPVYKKLKDVFYFENVEWLDCNLTGMDYLKFVKKGWDSSIDIEEIIHIWKMEEYIHLPIKKYSLGMKQRLIIAMYIISDAQYMIMDEITNGLDEENRTFFFQQLQDLKKKGKTMIVSSHYKDEIITVCDVVLQIKDMALCEVSL
ncbi:MAG: ABC transporter ATP-binding protein [Erysipelotrichaceae bacterium]|nr:ABC transporter ATP-binding protein [Erysipelotrichaceae bacterium]